MTARDAPPGKQEIEVTLMGPGYGETVVVHLGDGVWIVVDSCPGHDGRPQALTYLDRLGIDVSRQVRLVVATHWHDDHIRGMAKVVARCRAAVFCCSGALREKEFLMAVAALEEREPSDVGSGVRELYEVFRVLQDSKRTAKMALADRTLLRFGGSEVLALSPDDSRFRDFLRTVGQLVVATPRPKRRMATPRANAVSVVLHVRTGDTEVLLGGDLERGGWEAVLHNENRRQVRAGIFKIPHHGSGNADEPRVWDTMLSGEPRAVLAPWNRGGRALPTTADVRRILLRTPHAWASARQGRFLHRKNRKEVDRTLRERGGRPLLDSRSAGIVRFRKPLRNSASWRTETFGDACHLKDYAA